MGEPLLEDSKIREFVGDYIKTHYSDILKEEESRLFLHSRNEDPILLERMIRVEESSKNIQIQIDRNYESSIKRFEQMDKRFEDLIHLMDIRFEQVDKRFEQVDKRFEQVDKRFEQVDKRFDDLIHQMDKRFEQVDKRFNQMFTFMSLGFLMITTLMSVYQFII